MAKIAYIRVSTDAQNLSRQEDMSVRIGADKIFREKASGKNADRPELKRMLDYVRDGDTLYIESISRLARSVRDLLTIVDALLQKGVGFVSEHESIDTSTPQGRFVLTIFGALAELERESTAQRRDEGIAAARARGARFGRPAVVPPASLPDIFSAVLSHSITHAQGIQRSGLKRSTYYAMYAEWREQRTMQRSMQHIIQHESK